MNMTDKEVEAAILAHQEEHGEWPKPTAFAREYKVNYNRGRDAIERIKAQALGGPRQEVTDNPIPEPVLQAFKSAWNAAMKEANATLEVARENYDRKLTKLAEERDALAEEFDVIKDELAAMTKERDSLAGDVADLLSRVENAEQSAKVAELRAETLLEATKAMGVDLAARTSELGKVPAAKQPDTKTIAA